MQGQDSLAAGSQTHVAGKKTSFTAPLCFYNKNYRRFRAS
jgi:hypothetical protein